MSEEAVLILRTCNADMTAFGGFVWPTTGPAEAPDWDPEPVCGGGLHGLLWGEGDALLLHWSPDAKWLVVRVLAADVVLIDSAKVKFPRGVVECVGDRAAATQYLHNHGGRGYRIAGLICAGGYHSTLTGGDRSTLTGGYHSTLMGGDRSTLTGGDYSTLTGGYRSTLMGGDGSTLTGGDYSTLTGGYRSTLMGGDGSTLTGGNDSTLTGGNDSTLTGGHRSTLTGGDDSTLTGGDYSTLTFYWWDGTRRRITTVYVGEDGIEPNVPYRCEGGKVVPA